MKYKKYIPFEKAYNIIQKRLLAAMLNDGQIDQVKRDFAARKVEYTEELAEAIKIKYGNTQKSKGENLYEQYNK